MTNDTLTELDSNNQNNQNNPTSEKNPRRPLGPCNLLTIQEALKELAMRREDGKIWLKKHGLIKTVMGRKRIIAGDLADAVRQECERGNEKPSKAKLVDPFDSLPKFPF